MTTYSKKAAILRIRQIQDEFDAYLKSKYHPEYGSYGGRQRYITMDDNEKNFNWRLQEITELVDKYELEKDFISKFTTRYVNKIYQKAIKKKDFKFAMKFAEIHNI